MERIIDGLQDRKAVEYKEYLSDLETQLSLTDRKIEQFLDRIGEAAWECFSGVQDDGLQPRQFLPFQETV